MYIDFFPTCGSLEAALHRHMWSHATVDTLMAVIKIAQMQQRWSLYETIYFWYLFLRSVIYNQNVNSAQFEEGNAVHFIPLWPTVSFSILIDTSLESEAMIFGYFLRDSKTGFWYISCILISGNFWKRLKTVWYVYQNAQRHLSWVSMVHFVGLIFWWALF